jgi:hypothetical protein
LKGHTVKNELKTFDDLPIETLIEMANERGEEVEKHVKNAVFSAMACGKALTSAKKQIPHGEWLPWLGKNWNYSQQTASRYMSIAANYATIAELKDAKDINDALRMIAESKENETPREERKTGRVEVVKPAAEPVGQPVVQAEKQTQGTTDENAVPAEPKTNTQHRPENAKAQESRRTAPPVITPEIIDEPQPPVAPPKQWPEVSLEELVSAVLAKLEHDKQRKAAAKTLRKLADKLDPPTKFVPPTIEEVEAYCQERRAQGKPNNVDAEAFIAHYEKQKWKQSNGLKLENWRAAIITWEKKNDSRDQKAGTAIPGTGRIKPREFDESKIVWK